MEMCLSHNMGFSGYTESYDLIAEEYYSDRHITSRNFDQASKVYFKQKPITVSGLGLEIGAGNGRTDEYIECNTQKLILSDISSKMLNYSSYKSALARIRCDALNLPFTDESLNYVTAFLYDPFNIPYFYNEISRVLKLDGLFIGTLPHYIWGQTLRNVLKVPGDKTIFIKNDGSEVVIDSYLMSKDEIVSNANNAGLEVLRLENIYLPKQTTKISPHIVIPSRSLNISAYSLPIVSAIMLRKK